jgi:hypothetical protein
MSPKEKASELFDKFDKSVNSITSYPIKRCALIAVDEILDISYWAFMESGGKQEQEFWQEVKQEIEKL